MTTLRRVMHVRSSGTLLGAERVVLALAKHSSGFGYEPLVVSLQDTGDPVPEMSVLARELGLESLVLPCGRGLDRTLLQRLRATVRDRGIQVVHSHGYKEDIHLAVPRPKAVMVATNHLWKRTDWRLRLYARADAVALRRFDHVVAVSRPILDDMLQCGLRADRLSCIANGIDAGEFEFPFTDEARRAARRDFGFHEDDVVIVSVSSLTKAKGHTYLLQALRNLYRDVPQLRYLIVGDGPTREDLQSQVAQFGLQDHVVLAGRRSDISRLLQAADIFALPSLIEGLPIALLEAMAAGLPAVASSTGDVATAIEDGRNGTLCAPECVPELTAALRRYASDPSVRLAHGARARTTVTERFSSRSMTGAYCALYDDLISRRHKQ